MRPIFSAGGQALKVRALQVLSLPMAPFCLWGAWITARGYGLESAFAEPQPPLVARLAIAAFMAVVGAGFPIGMWVYGRCYVNRAEVDEERDLLRITLAGFLVPARLEVSLGTVTGTRDHDGRFFAGGVSVDAPWTGVRLRDRRLPLIVDAQGDVLDRALVNRYLLGDR